MSNTDDYWKSLGYDTPRGIPCCRTNALGYRCSCAEPAPIPEGQRKRDPYRPHQKTATKLRESVVQNAGPVQADTVDCEYDEDGKPPLLLADRIRSLGLHVEKQFDDELGPYGLYIPRPTQARRKRDAVSQKREALCAFEHNGSFFMAQPQLLFKPLGLMIWGAPEGATMEAAYVGNMMQLLVSMGKFPAAWFAQSQSFEQIFERAKEGLVPASFGSWDTCKVGMLLRVMIESKTGAQLGPQDGVQIGMWGWTVSL